MDRPRRHLSAVQGQTLSGGREMIVEIERLDQQFKDSDNNAKHTKEEVHGLRRGKSVEKNSFIKAKSRFGESSRRSYSLDNSETKSPKVTNDEEELLYANDMPNLPKTKWSAWAFLGWIVFIVLTSLMVVSLTHGLKNDKLWGLEIWNWCLMMLVVFCGRLTSGWFVAVLVFMIEMNFILRKRVLYFVYGLKDSVRNCIWLSLAIAVWFCLFDPRVKRNKKTHKALEYLTKGLIAVLVVSVIWLFKTLFIKFLASRFHAKTFFNRIRESIFNQHILDTLSRPMVTPDDGCINKQDDARNSTMILNLLFSKAPKKFHGDSSLNIQQLQHMNAKNVSAWNMARLVKRMRKSEHITLSIAIDETDQTVITDETEAMDVADKIFKSVTNSHAKFIEKKDLLRFLNQNEVDEIFPKFEGATESGKINRAALENWVRDVYLEGKALAHALKDSKTAVNELDNIVSGMVIIASLLVSVMITGLITTRVLLILSSQLVLVAFIFGNACKQVFEAIIFVFVRHPFDVGDRCVVDGVQMVVEEMSILITTFLRDDNEKIFYPNSVLSTKPISNFQRSPEMGDCITFNIDALTPVDRIMEMKAGIASYIESKPHHWSPKHCVVVQDIKNMNSLEMILCVTHTINFQNFGEKTERRTDLLMELKKVFERFNIKYRLLPRDVNVRMVEQGMNQDRFE